MNPNYLSFDIETNPVDFDTNWWQYPELIRMYIYGVHSANYAKPYLRNPRTMKPFSRKAVIDVIECLEKKDNTIVTHNGLRFDFLVLGILSGQKERCLELALNSVDLWLNLYCTINKKVSLDSLAKSTLEEGKLGFPSKDFEQAWLGGQQVLCEKYLSVDLGLTLRLANYARDNGKLKLWGDEFGIELETVQENLDYLKRVRVLDYDEVMQGWK